MLKSQNKDFSVARVCVCTGVCLLGRARYLGRPCRRPSGGTRCGRCSGPGLGPSDTSGSSPRCSGCSCPRWSAALQDTNGRKQMPRAPPPSGPEPRDSSGFSGSGFIRAVGSLPVQPVSKLGGRFRELGGVHSRQSWCGCSSVPSPQSLTSLQTFLWPMQRPFPHWNWSGAQGGLSVWERESRLRASYRLGGVKHLRGICLWKLI